MKKIISVVFTLMMLVNAQAQEIAEVSLLDPDFYLGTAQLNGRLVYCSSNGIDQRIVFTDGTNAGTNSLFVPEIAGDLISGFMEYNDKVYFSANGLAGRELWVTDGTLAGTIMLKDIRPSGSSNPKHFVELNNTLYFIASDGVNGEELWKTDGTAIGTLLVKDMNPGIGGSEPTNILVYNNALYFGAWATYGKELWKSDGTTNGTVVLKEIYPSVGGNPNGFFEHQGKVYFHANSGSQGIELFVTDGTEQGTEIVADIATGIDNSTPYDFFSVGDYLFFKAETPSSGIELFWYNSQSGSIGMHDFNSNSSSSYPSAVGYIDDKLLVTATNGIGNFRMYTFDLNSGIIEELVDLDLDYSESGFMMPKILDDKLFFCANDGTNGREIWYTDATSIGTLKLSPIIDINGDPLQDADELIWFNNMLFFRGSYSANGSVLCKVYDPTLGVDEVEKDKLNIYPNPANDIVNIELKENQSIEIVDVLGNVVWNQEMEKGISSVKISSFNNGIYFVKTQSSTYSTKLLINR